MGLSSADPIGPLGVLAITALIAWRILSSNLSILVDRVVIDAERIRGVALAVPGVVDCHRVRSRGVAGSVHLDLHILVDGSHPLRIAHELSNLVEARLKATFPDVGYVTIHMEPEGETAEGL